MKTKMLILGLLIASSNLSAQEETPKHYRFHDTCYFVAYFVDTANYLPADFKVILQFDSLLLSYSGRKVNQMTHFDFNFFGKTSQHVILSIVKGSKVYYNALLNVTNDTPFFPININDPYYHKPFSEYEQ